MRFVFDNNMSHKLPKGLSEFGEDAVHLTDEFAPDTPDEEWIPKVGARGWVLVTHDVKITRRPLQLQAFMDAELGAFFFVQRKKLGHWGWVELVVKHWRRMTQLAAATSRPFAFTVGERGISRQLR